MGTVLLQAVIDGVLNGGLYAAIAVGLSLSFGVMRVVNWAHGECLMISMYISYVIFTLTKLDPYVCMLGTAVVMFGFGYVLQHFVFNPMLERDAAREPTSIMLFGGGLGFAISALAIMIFGTLPTTEKTIYTGKTIFVNDLYFSVPRAIAFVLAMAFTLILYYIIQKTELGCRVRATSQNRFVAQLMGINVKQIYCLVFALGMALVGMSGGLLAPYYPMLPTSGATFGFRTFIIVVLGGKGSIPGALIGGLIVGLIEKVFGLLISDTYAQVITFVIFIFVLLLKPNGLLGKEAE